MRKCLIFEIKLYSSYRVLLKAIPKCKLGSHINVIICSWNSNFIPSVFLENWKKKDFEIFFPSFEEGKWNIIHPCWGSPWADIEGAARGPGSRRSIGGKFFIQFHKTNSAPPPPPPPPPPLNFFFFFFQNFQNNVKKY